MKHKHKNKKRAQRLFKSKVWRKKHDPFLLAVVLVVFIALETASLGTATLADWQHGVALIDVSSQVASAAADFHEAVQPIVDVAVYINQFFQEAADQMAFLLNDEDNVAFAADGLAAFGRLASKDAYQLFDISEYNPWFGKVAGAYIDKSCSN